MITRIQVVVEEEERESFRRQAHTEGLSLSALAATGYPRTPERTRAAVGRGRRPPQALREM